MRGKDGSQDVHNSGEGLSRCWEMSVRVSECREEVEGIERLTSRRRREKQRLSSPTLQLLPRLALPPRALAQPTQPPHQHPL